MPDSDHIVEAIKAYCRAETDKDLDGFLALFSENVVHEDPVGITKREGIAGVTSLFALATGNDVNLWLTDEIIVRGNEAIALMACETGPAEARRKSGRIVDHFVFEDSGKIASVRAFYNLP